jgi:NAD+ synthase (glutamine-hydrolysing)
MKLIKLAAAVLNQTPLDWANNQANILGAIESARRDQVSILCLPEMCITGYGCEDAFHSTGVHATAVDVLHALLPATKGMIVSLGLPLMHAGGVFNTACLVADGNILGFVGKQFLAGDGIHYEPRWFKRWPAHTISSVELHGREYPLGDLLFRCDDVQIGFEICEDAWVGERPGSALAARGADVILNPSASHFAFGKHEVRQRFVLEGSRAFQVTYVYSNLVGNESGRAIYDGDAMIASNGKLVAVGPRFTFSDFHLTTAVVNVEMTRMQRARTNSFVPDVDNEPEETVACEFEFPALAPKVGSMQREAWETGTSLKEEEFTRAVSLGLFDYMRKSRSRGVVVSLSGGADSAAVTALSGMMLQFAAEQLGIPRLLQKLAYNKELAICTTIEEIISRLITTVYQSTRNSGPVTRHAAQTIAAAIGARHYEFDVDQIVQLYRQTVEQKLGRELTWEQDDIALQNIQARARSPGVWMLANLQQGLLLSTSNRSEAAVGYATMDGDTSGGLSPIAGIDKAYLRRWLVWLEREGPAGLGPIPEMNVINAQQPTAELRPAHSAQTDEGDLMPYTILDEVERLAIRDKLLPLEVLQMIAVAHPEHSLKQLSIWVDRFFRLWCRNQWKRERYAPSFHLDDANLDPKTWCRFPILSGGFERELKQMHDYVRQSDSGVGTA